MPRIVTARRAGGVLRVLTASLIDAAPDAVMPRRIERGIGRVLDLNVHLRARLRYDGGAGGIAYKRQPISLSCGRLLRPEHPIGMRKSESGLTPDQNRRLANITVDAAQCARDPMTSFDSELK